MPITINNKKYIACEFKEGEKTAGLIYLNENGDMKVREKREGYEIVINGREIVITKK